MIYIHIEMDSRRLSHIGEYSAWHAACSHPSWNSSTPSMTMGIACNGRPQQKHMVDCTDLKWSNRINHYSTDAGCHHQGRPSWQNRHVCDRPSLGITERSHKNGSWRLPSKNEYPWSPKVVPSRSSISYNIKITVQLGLIN